MSGHRMTVYVSDAIWRAVKKRKLPVSRILEKALRNYITDGGDGEFHYALNKVLKNRLKRISKLCKLKQK